MYSAQKMCHRSIPYYGWNHTLNHIRLHSSVINDNVREGGEERKKAVKVMLNSSVVFLMCLEWSSETERRRAKMCLCGAHVTGTAYLVMILNFN